MIEQLRLKKPFFITFTMEGITREEAVRYLQFNDRARADGEPLHGYQDVDDMIGRLDTDGRDEAEVRELLENSDLDFTLREAYLGAEYRARDYCWAAARRDVSEPAPVRFLTREERKERSWREVQGIINEYPAYLDKLVTYAAEAERRGETPEQAADRADREVKAFLGRLADQEADQDKVNALRDGMAGASEAVS